MGVNNIISLLGGLAFFLFGMSLMGESLKKVAGNRLELILGRLASTKIKAVLLGTFVTAIIQSSSATSIMVVSFVNSGIMKLTQGICVIMGANIGTTATGWILTLASIGGENDIGSYLSTTFIFAVVAIIGIVLYMFGKTPTKKHTGAILVSLSILMTGMKTMSAATEPLQESEAFMQALSVVSNPFLCILIGIAATAVVQSCSASIGILQALSMNGVISYAVAIPTVVGMSIGACVPVLISSVGANKNGKRTAFSYLYFNLLGGFAFMIIYFIVSSTDWGKAFTSQTANSMNIAVVNTTFKVFAVVVLFPFISLLEKLSRLTFRDSKYASEVDILDERLLGFPTLAIERSLGIVHLMADIARNNVLLSISLFERFDKRKFEKLMQDENEEDCLDDKLSDFLVKLNSKELTMQETRRTAMFLRSVADLERISDHSENIAELAQELGLNGKKFTKQATSEMQVCFEAVTEILDIAIKALVEDDLEAAYHVEPLEETVDALTANLKQRHIQRLQKGICTIEMGIIFNDCINNLERIADHCSNIAVSVIELHDETVLDPHDYLRSVKESEGGQFIELYNIYKEKYSDRLQTIDIM